MGIWGDFAQVAGVEEEILCPYFLGLDHGCPTPGGMMKAKKHCALSDFQIFRLSNWEGRDCGSAVQYCVSWRGRGFGGQFGAIRANPTRSNRSTAGLSDIFRFFRYLFRAKNAKESWDKDEGTTEKKGRVRYG